MARVSRIQYRQPQGTEPAGRRCAQIAVRPLVADATLTIVSRAEEATPPHASRGAVARRVRHRLQRPAHLCYSFRRSISR
jgi:hypothetical protein